MPTRVQRDGAGGLESGRPPTRAGVGVPYGGSITFRSRFLDFTGKTVLHCHMKNHEGLGMMQVIEVSEPA